MPARIIVDDRVIVGVPVAVPGQQVARLWDQGVGNMRKGEACLAPTLALENSHTFSDNLGLQIRFFREKTIR